LIVAGRPPGAGDVSGKCPILCWRVCRLEDEGAQISNDAYGFKGGDLHRSSAAIEAEAKVDQRTTGVIKPLLHVVADDGVKAWPAQYGADDARRGDPDLEGAGDVSAQGMKGGIPQAHA